MTESKIQDQLYYSYPFRHHDGRCPNVYMYAWESDFISITKAGFVHECEIKISVSDFRADAKKEQKHEIFKTGERSRPNYFWYVCSDNEIPVDEVPAYAGLINLNGRPYKPAPRLHRDKITDKQRMHIVRSFDFKYWRLRFEKETIVKPV